MSISSSTLDALSLNASLTNLESLCLVRLVGFASSRALDRQYVETPFRPAILTKCASFRGWRSIR